MTGSRPSQLKVVLITTGQPALNPRLVKEADALAGVGYDITVLYAYWNQWGTAVDGQILKQKKWKAIRVGGDPVDGKGIYWFSRIAHRLVRVMLQPFNLKFLAESAISRSTKALTSAACGQKADLYIAHNLGALPAAVKAAKQNKALCGFDAEDYHRFETSDDTDNLDVRLKIFIEDKYIPQVNYFSASSQQIAEAYTIHYPEKKPFVLLNVMNRAASHPSVSQSGGPLKLFWFSQVVGPNRGLEMLAEVAATFAQGLELHLLGAVSEEFKQKLLQIMPNIWFYEPMEPDAIPGFASGFDIGLALEQHKPLNRDLCLTNKIFTYLQAGLAIIASDTLAQSSFLKQYPDTGRLYSIEDKMSLKNALAHFENDLESLNEARSMSYLLGQEKLNWEEAQQDFLSLINQLLAS